METTGGGEDLRLKDEEPKKNLNRSSSLTLHAVLRDKMAADEPPLQRSHSNRTLMDVIRDESSDSQTDRKNWKDKLRLNRNGSGSNWTSSVPVPTSDVPVSNSNNIGNNRSMERASGRFEHTSSLAMRRLKREKDDDDEDETAMRRLQRDRNHDEDDDDDDEEEEERFEDASASAAGAGDEDAGGAGDNAGGEGEGEREEEPVRMSLMSLLAETDREMGLDGSTYMMDEDEEEEEEEEEESGGVEYNNCCVCMVRHKGAAFIPCGHTFCRLCSRELFAQRGSCPLCNNYILEILDIF